MNVLRPHLSLNVTDIDASVAFYEKVFDVPATKHRAGCAKVDLKAPSLNLSMVSWVEDPEGNMWEVFVVKGESLTMREGQQTACCTPLTTERKDGVVPPSAERRCC